MRDCQGNHISEVVDHLQHTLLHIAVELQNKIFFKFLVDIGCNVNAKGCGLTPLNIAVVKDDSEIARFLVDSGAKFSGPLFTGIPSPLEMAQVLASKSIERIFLVSKFEGNEVIELFSQGTLEA